MNLVLETLWAILLALNQLANLLISMFIFAIRSFRLLPQISPNVSSANRKVKSSVALGKSLM